MHVSHITTDELLQKIHANEDIILVDTREEPELQYNVEHIEVAISQPLSDIVSGAWKPDILEQEIVLYRTYGNTSDRATLELIDYGYTNVKTL